MANDSRPLSGAASTSDQNSNTPLASGAAVVIPSQGVNPQAQKLVSLVEACVEMRDALLVFRQISSRAEMIAINASIEGARLKTRLPDFAQVAEEMQGQALRNVQLCQTLDALISKLQTVVLKSTAIRYYELAEDLIDKIDRNLFERNCDCQAWATFESIVACTQKSLPMDSQAIVSAFNSDEIFKSTAALLDKLTTTYVVYSDIFLLNQRGMVVNAAKHREWVGASFESEDWFREAIQGRVHVSDMRYCQAIQGYSVFYSAPVLDAEGKVLGVLTTRFNWDYAQEMIASAAYDKDIRAYYLNEGGEVIGSTGRLGTKADHMHWLDAGLSASEGHCGYSIELARNGTKIAVGYARTRGYNSYRGKKWSGLLIKRLGHAELKFLEEIVDTRSDANPLGNRYSDKTKPIESETANLELIKIVEEIVKHVEQVTANNKEVKFLAINASVQAGRAGPEGDSFSIIAEDIGRLAQNSLAFVSSVQNAAQNLAMTVQGTVANRLKDAARDAADKVDRNLFERYCDVQAWTTFRQFIETAKAGKPSQETNALLAKLHKIYEVYHDIILVDKRGVIVGAGINQHLLGQNQCTRGWFKEALAGKVNFTDVYHSPSLGQPVVTFSAPIYDQAGQVIGVLSTRFNCNFLNDIIRAVIAPVKSSVYLVNSQGMVIASLENDEIMTRSFNRLQAFKDVQTNDAGTTIEKDSQDGVEYNIGYGKAKGYNTYPGRGWSILIRLPIASKPSGN